MVLNNEKFKMLLKHFGKEEIFSCLQYSVCSISCVLSEARFVFQYILVSACTLGKKKGRSKASLQTLFWAHRLAPPQWVSGLSHANTCCLVTGSHSVMGQLLSHTCRFCSGAICKMFGVQKSNGLCVLPQEGGPWAIVPTVWGAAKAWRESSKDLTLASHVHSVHVCLLACVCMLERG